MIRQLVGCLEKNLPKYFPEEVKNYLKGYDIVCCYDKSFDIKVNVEKQMIKISNFSLEYIWAWTAHWFFLYDYCKDEKLTLSEFIEQWDLIKKKTQIKRTLLLLKLMEFNEKQPLEKQSPWLLKHLNPMEVKKSIVEKINIVFNYVVMNMILHEIGHIKYDHETSPSATTNDDNQRMESDADDFSYDEYIKILAPVADNFIKDFAWIGVILSQLLIFNLSHLNASYLKKYGNPCNRLDHALSSLDSREFFVDNHPIYAFLSLVLWLCLKNDGVYVSSNEKVTFKEQYSELMLALNKKIKEFNFI